MKYAAKYGVSQAKFPAEKAKLRACRLHCAGNKPFRLLNNFYFKYCLIGGHFTNAREDFACL